MGTENIHVSVENDKRLNLNVNIGQGDEIKVPVTIGGGGGGNCDIDTTELASKDLERFFGLPSALPEYEPMTEEELITQAEDIWNTIFNE